MSEAGRLPMRFEAPRGMRDFYPEDMSVRNFIFDAWRCAAHDFGFRQYDACVVETLALLKRKGGEEIVDQIYAFRDKSDRELALRPEITPSLARMVAARRGALSFPLKWFAVAQCFRYERMSRGRKREHYQWNLDVLGEDSPAAEAEILACAADALRRLGLGAGEVAIRVSSRALLSDLLAQGGIAPEHHPAIFLALDKRGKLDEQAVGKMLREAGLDHAGVDAVNRIMALATPEQAAAMLGGTPPALAELLALLRMLDDYGLGAMACFDIGVVRGLGYYTGIVFEAFDCAGEFRAIFGGGRYNRLLSDLGGAGLPAVGLGFGDVVITELLRARARLPQGAGGFDCAIGYMSSAEQAIARRLAHHLRQAGQSVELALSPEKPRAFFGRIGQGDFLRAVYLGPDDLARGTMRVKDLRARTESEHPLPD